MEMYLASLVLIHGVRGMVVRNTLQFAGGSNSVDVVTNIQQQQSAQKNTQIKPNETLGSRKQGEVGADQELCFRTSCFAPS